MKAFQQLPPRREPPGQLAENLVLFVLAWKCGVGSRLTVRITQMLVAGEEPKPVAQDWTAKIRAQIVVRDALVSTGVPARTRIGQVDRLARESAGLSVIRCV